MKKFLLFALAGLLPACATAGGGPSRAVAPTAEYNVWVTSESADQIAQVRFGPGGAEVVRTRAVGMMPVEIDGPHGVAIAPDGRYLYVSIGHGVPFGWLWKIEAETLEVVGRTMLGHFPATVAVTPDGEFGFISNFNLHGDHVPSSISKVHLPTMAEVARTETCVMPHGSRVDPQGERHFSVCMMDELLVEIDVGTGAVSRTFSLARGREGSTAHEGHRGAVTAHDQSGASVAAAQEVCSPTWAEPSADGRRVFVTCNRAREVLEIDVERWELVRRFDTGESPYNIGVTPDGRYLLVTLRNRTEPALEVFDLGTGRQLGRVATSTTFPHGIAVSGDSRYAFVSVEGVGAEPGRVDVIDVRALRRVDSVGVGQQATGIAMVEGSD